MWEALAPAARLHIESLGEDLRAEHRTGRILGRCLRMFTALGVHLWWLSCDGGRRWTFIHRVGVGFGPWGRRRVDDHALHDARSHGRVSAEDQRDPDSARALTGGTEQQAGRSREPPGRIGVAKAEEGHPAPTRMPGEHPLGPIGHAAVGQVGALGVEAVRRSRCEDRGR